MRQKTIDARSARLKGLAKYHQAHGFKGEERGAYIEIGEHSKTRKNRGDHLKMGTNNTIAQILPNLFAKHRLWGLSFEVRIKL